MLNLRLYISEADKEVLNKFEGSLETEAGAVDDEIMAVRCAPLAIRVELVIGPSGLVDALQDLFGSEAVRDVLRPHDAFDAYILGGVNENADDVVIVRENIVRAASYEDRGFLVGLLADDP